MPVLFQVCLFLRVHFFLNKECLFKCVVPSVLLPQQPLLRRRRRIRLWVGRNELLFVLPLTFFFFFFFIKLDLCDPCSLRPLPVLCDWDHRFEVRSAQGRTRVCPSARVLVWFAWFGHRRSEVWIVLRSLQRIFIHRGLIKNPFLKYICSVVLQLRCGLSLD